MIPGLIGGKNTSLVNNELANKVAGTVTVGFIKTAKVIGC
jgi:hypothetical protein